MRTRGPQYAGPSTLNMRRSRGHMLVQLLTPLGDAGLAVVLGSADAA